MLKNVRYLYLFAFIVFIGCCLVVVAQPNRFQKWNSMKSVNEFQLSRDLGFGNQLDLESFINNIPYQNSSDYVYAVHPEVKYNTTILNGYGDCSTMSFGAAYFLLKERIPFELIYFLPPQQLFTGGGHVALRLLYNYRGETKPGIVDLAGGGLPSVEDEFIDIVVLEDITLPKYLYRINDKASSFYESYYEADYLENVFFGFTPGREVETYFDFLERYYVSIGNERLEKMLYDGLAILFGSYYSIYVDDVFLDKFKAEIFFFNTVLYYIRIFLLFSLCLFIYTLYNALRRDRRNYEV